MEGVLAFFLILVIAIVFLMFLIIKANMHPVLSLLFVGLFAGIAMGFTPIKSVKLITEGFGGTLQNVGIPIMLGAVLAMGIRDTGAAKSIANFFIRLFRGKNLELAPSLTGYIVSIPVFGDITTVLTANIASVLSARKGISMSTMAAFTELGLNLTHAVVPPTPGILAVALMLGADLGLTIIWGIVVTFIAFLISWLLLKRWTEKEKIDPISDFVKGIQRVESNNIEDLMIKGETLPNTFESLLPILIPVFLIATSSLTNIYLPEQNTIRNIFVFLGDKVIAMLLGLIYTMFLGLKYKKSVISSNREFNENNKGNANISDSIKDILLNSWISRGLYIALPALLITGMGGAFSNIIKSAPAVEHIASYAVKIPIPPVLIPFFLGVIMMTAVGSMTTAGLTAASLVIPMLPALGLSPLAATLAIGAGTLAINHVNNSGFWVTTQFFHLNTKQGLKYITVPGIVGALACIAVILVINMIGLI
ncbi:H+/gluconate symporter family protein [Acetomicrobium mobile DSM 13181]|uniref:H+/gluconate symporter family protein n=1 Tax=Acetomicrobium mobile (strain ATCC BAA-54 / DSM 13181 / JCM 12221 / NGA) TaxID=891968 RepID=I4BXD2_ACEMN|nr:SLC13 family permease [Acetomicrobium mobile]AFM21939.1 H+/gluconate symporter family protein [Acetomicrobium mobile DSM 13181]